MTQDATPDASARAREVVVLGEALWDLFPARAGDALRTRKTEVRHVGGAPANVACTLARLGIDVALIAAVGDDELGRGLVDRIRDAGVDVSGVVTVPARTGVTFVDLGADGARRFLPYRAPSADMLLPADAIAPERLRTRWLHVGSSSFARPPARDATLRALEIARANDARVSIDLNVYPHLWPRDVDPARALSDVIETADLVKASEADLRALGLGEGHDGARRLHARRPARITLVTLGASGALACFGDHVSEAPARRVKVVDETGAGDAFVAGALSTLVRAGLDGDRVRTSAAALRLGNELGARAVRRIGSTTALSDLGRAREALARGPRRR